MDPKKRQELTSSLSKLSAEIAADLQKQMLERPEITERAQKLHADERVGEDFKVWTGLLSRRAAVLWVLKSVYVRVIEDRGLLRPHRILDPESEQQLFAALAPNLGPTAYLRWVYRDLASPVGGLPELFSPQPAELALPGDQLTRKLIDFWRASDPDTGVLRFRFDDEHFDGSLMGDLYQDLDPVVKKRYALLQTPDFVLNFILDETLTPAIKEFGVETVRLLDPACGSGHFLLAGFKRLVAGMREKYPERPVRTIVEDVLPRVVGIDLNDYACGLARARLVMTALETCGETELGAASEFHPQVFWADALEQVEREQPEQLGLVGILPEAKKARAMLTRPEVRAALRPVLQAKFHVVVGNPPYITEKDKKKREYHKEKIGKNRRYVSAARKYSLGAPFTERMFQLAVEQGFVGEITADSFMKREFGKPLIEQVLARKDLTDVVVTSGAHIPGHGTPTVIVIGRQRAPSVGPVRVVMGKRGEPGKPNDPAKGKVWTSIMEGHATLGWENEYVSVADVDRATMAKHPWSIGGGGAAELKEALDEVAQSKLSARIESIGFMAITGEDDAFLRPIKAWARVGAELERVRPLCSGDEVRDWTLVPMLATFFPYDLDGVVQPASYPMCSRLMWPVRRTLLDRPDFGGKKYVDVGRTWFEFHQIPVGRLRTLLSIAFGEVATHNHFVLDRGGKVFNRTAPVIKLPSGASEADHLVLLSQLNSSTAEFWMKQVYQPKGGDKTGDGARVTGETWEERYQRDGTKLHSFPVAAVADAVLVDFASELDKVASERASSSARAVVDRQAAAGTRSLRRFLDERREEDTQRLLRIVGLQEELDWYCYRLYGVEPDVETRRPADVPPLRPGLRPFELTLAQEDAERREAVERGEDPDEAPTEWFTRHGWAPVTTVDDLPEGERRIAQDRLDRTAASRNLALIEQPTFKRRWYKPNYEKEEREALTEYLADRIEDWVGGQEEPFTSGHAASALRDDPGVLAVCEILAGRPDFDLDGLIAERLRLDSVPNNKHHAYKPDGLRKRAAWEETWRLQHLEDIGQNVVPPAPPKYAKEDFLRSEFWDHRGKLDVPKERYIAFTEVSGATGENALYGWAGWTHRQRAKALLELDEQLGNEGVALEDRYGILYGVGFLLPYVAWESKSAADEFQSIVSSMVGKAGVTESMLQEWATKHPSGQPARRKAAKPKTAAKKSKKGEAITASDGEGE